VVNGQPVGKSAATSFVCLIHDDFLGVWHSGAQPKTEGEADIASRASTPLRHSTYFVNEVILGLGLSFEVESVDSAESGKYTKIQDLHWNQIFATGVPA
jgi:hypothetical protein